MSQQPRYQVIERIDAGGMAEVFKAKSTSLHGFHKLVAIKRVLPDLTKNQRFVRMFLDEAKVSLFLNHTNVVQVFDLGIADGTYFIVMEFIDGTNLKKFIEEQRNRNQKIPDEQAAFIALEICKGLAHAHEKYDNEGNRLEIVHRDISPPNVLMSREGEVKITDFGLAKAKSQVEQTDPGVVKGKFGYLSPEAAHGEDVDARTDIFAVGIVLWEMLTGERLFQGETDYETLQQVRSSEIPLPSERGAQIAPELERIVRRSLSRDIDERYQSARDLGRDLAHFLFTYGEPVSSFDIASQVDQILRRTPQKSRPAQDSAIQEAVQKQVNQIKSLEEIDDLDQFMAQHFGAIAVEGDDSPIAVDGDFEDPRSWADMSWGEETADHFAQSVDTPAPGDGQPSWQEGSLDELRKVTRAQRAVSAEDAPEPDPADERTRELGSDQLAAIRAERRDGQGAPPAGKEGGPPPRPDASRDGKTASARTQPGTSAQPSPPRNFSGESTSSGGGSDARERRDASGSSGGATAPPANPHAGRDQAVAAQNLSGQPGGDSDSSGSVLPRIVAGVLALLVVGALISVAWLFLK